MSVPIDDTEVLSIFEEQGSWVYIQHRTSGSESSWYDTGSTDGYGYGDPIIMFTGSSNTGSWIKCIVDPVNADEVRFDAGFTADNYRKVIFSGSTTIDEWDLLYYPSGSDQDEFLILPIMPIQTGNTTLLKVSYVRCTIPTKKQF